MSAGNKLRVGIVGCGLIGQKRAQSIVTSDECCLVACADPVLERARSVARTADGAEAFQDWRALIARSDVDAVMVATTHDVLAEISLGAARLGKHVLVEKPAARCPAELRAVVDEARDRGVVVRVGFNHRHHPALRKAMEVYRAGFIGELMFIRGRYGHGGRIGYDQEWRARPELSGGGELIDQGIHLIDLARWFLGDFVDVQGFARTYFWDMPVEDNGFMMLRTDRQQVAFLHASCTEWKNLFSFEIYGRGGKLEVSGLGGSYGVERLAFYRMLPEMGPPETTIWEYPMGDNSWKLELSEFAEDVRLNRAPSPGLPDAIAALEIIEKIYEASNR